MKISFNILLSNILLTCIIESHGDNYCTSNICRNNKQHCSFQQSQTPARHCIDLEELIKTDDDRRAILHKINSRRNKVAAGELRSYPSANNMMKLEWNTKLEQSAQRWAKQCVKNSMPDIKDACRDLDTEGASVGQNIGTIYGESPGLLVTALVDVWYMELLNNNGSILARFRESSPTGPQYEHFTQLVWAESREVGCGGVKFKERLQDQDSNKNRTVYRLVCNFVPSGNRDNKSVYTFGIPCTRCPNGTACDVVYNALCSKIISNNRSDSINGTKEKIHPQGNQADFYDKTEKTAEEFITTNSFDKENDLENYTLFDYFSHLHEYTRQAVTVTTTPRAECKDVLAVDEFINLLKKKLSNDHMFKELLLASKTTQGLNSDTNFTDASVAAFINKIYSKKLPSTTTKSTNSEILNSTLLVDLVEAVIFRSGDKTPARVVVEENTDPMHEVNPIKIQAEVAKVQENEDFTGHYFFPEEDEVNNSTEPTDYYDVTNPSISNILLEIEDIKKNRLTKNFLDDILESESTESSTESPTTVIFLSPDNLNAHKTGHEVMKKFLEDIKEKST